MTKRILLLLVLAGVVLIGGCNSADKKATGKIAVHKQNEPIPEVVAKAEKWLEDGKFRKVDKVLKKWLKKNDDSSWADHALYLRAQALLSRKNYYGALRCYDELTDKHSTSRHFVPALKQSVELSDRFLKGEKRWLFGFMPITARTEALASLQKVAERWPGSELAARALMMRGDYYYKDRQYLEAQLEYQLIVDNYVNSSFYEPAMLLNAESTYLMYTGPRYDGRCLAEARVRYEQYRGRFPEKAAALGIDKKIDDIVNHQLEKEYLAADFYDRTNRKGAAKYYYHNVARQGGYTVWGQKANERLLKLENNQ